MSPRFEAFLFASGLSLAPALLFYMTFNAF
jgi:hypothetical protein